jgi:hypothetical protein
MLFALLPASLGKITYDTVPSTVHSKLDHQDIYGLNLI